MPFILDEGTIFEAHNEDRVGYQLPKLDVAQKVPNQYFRVSDLGLPQVSEMDVIRHFTRLSTMNYSIDAGMYPLGSCTMKYNPKINDEIASLEGFRNIHPFQPQETVKGALVVLAHLQKVLAELTGLPAVSLQPAAGAHGEFTGIKVIRAYLNDHGGVRKKMLIPDTAHGTNPATSTLCQYEVVRVPTGSDGILEVEDIRRLMDDETAGLMVTNPNTLGLFEKNLKEICDIVHHHGGFVYCDGANFNAIMGWSRPGDLGVDVMHLNLHKTFSTPHGGGGPGAGPICVTEKLRTYLPIPHIVEKSENLSFEYDVPKSIGRVRMAYGNFLVLLRALVYSLSLGKQGLKNASAVAVINANYILSNLKEYFHLPYGPTCMHECVFSDKIQNRSNVKTMEIAKRLMDYGFHPPTVYFPLIISGAMMIEPTETEPLHEIDRFINAMKSIAKECEENPELVRSSPHSVSVSRVDETEAAKKLILTRNKN